MPDLKQVLRDNTFRLLNAERPMKSNETGIRRLVAMGIGQGTAQRILEGKTSVGLETLEQLAGVLGVSPWHLIQPLTAEVFPGELVNAKALKRPSAVSTEVLQLFESLPAAQRAAVRTVLKSMAIAGRTS